MPVKEHLLKNGNITFIIEHKTDEIEKVYFQFVGSYDTHSIPDVVTHRPENQIKYTDFRFANIYFQIYHELQNIVCIRYKYDNFLDYFHVKEFKTYNVDDDDTISQSGES